MTTQQMSESEFMEIEFQDKVDYAKLASAFLFANNAPSVAVDAVEFLIQNAYRTHQLEQIAGRMAEALKEISTKEEGIYSCDDEFVIKEMKEIAKLALAEWEKVKS